MRVARGLVCAALVGCPLVHSLEASAQAKPTAAPAKPATAGAKPEAKAADTKAADTKAAGSKAGPAKPTDPKTNDPKAADAKPEASDAADAKPAPAKPDEETVKRAASHFERGLQLYNDAEYRLALIEFERAYQLVPNYRVKYNIAQVSIQIGRYAHALHALEDYLEEGGENISDERRASVKNDLTMLAGRTARVLITSNIQGAEILLDEVVIGQTPLAEKILIDAGEHRLTVRQRGYQPRTEQVTLAGGDDTELNFELSEVKPEEPVVLVKEVHKETPQQGPTQPKPEPFPYATVGWVVTGGLAAGAVAAGVIGLGAKNELDNLASPDPGQDPEQVKADMDAAEKKARTWFLAADIMTGAAIAAGAASLYFTLVDADDDPVRDNSSRVTPKATGLSLRGRAGLNGVWLEGRF